MRVTPSCSSLTPITTALGALILVGLCPMSASGERLTSPAQPGQVEKRFQKPREPSAARRGKASQTEPAREASPRPVPEGPTFVLKGITFEGMTVFDPAVFRPLYEKWLNQSVSLTDLEQVARLVTTTYRNRGYVLSRVVIPQQDVRDGNVRIRVVEGYVGQATFSGLRDEPRLARRMADKVVASRPLQAEDLERYTLLMNDLPGFRTESIFSPLAGQTGAARMEIRAEEKRWDATLAADNRGTRYNGPYQFQVAAGANSLLRRFDRTSLLGITTDCSEELQLLSATHEQPLGSEGTRLSFTALFSRQEPGYILADVDTESDSNRLTGEIRHPIVRTREKSVTARLAFSAYNIETEQMDAIISRENLRLLRLGLTCDWSDRGRGVNVLDLEFSQGLDVLGALRTGASDLSRPAGRSDFSKFDLYLAREQYLLSHWSLALKASGQFACTPLLASEEFAFGGVPFGRAHDPSEILGDHGLAGSLELRYTGATPWRYPQRWQAYGYWDAGEVWRKDLETREANDFASGAGLGLRVNIDRLRHCSLELGKPLAGHVASRGSDDAYDWRVFFSVTAGF